MRPIETVGWAERGEAQQPRLAPSHSLIRPASSTTRLCNPGLLGFATLSTNLPLAAP